MAEDGEWVEIGIVGAPHGLRGELRFFAHNPESPLFEALPLEGVRLVADGVTRMTRVLSLRGGGRGFIVRLEGVNGRDGAASLTHARLQIERTRFPAAEDGYHVFELEGLRAIDPDGAEVGRVRTVADHGAGDILVLDTPRGELLLPFAEPWVGEIRVEEGTVEVDPALWLDED